MKNFHSSLFNRTLGNVFGILFLFSILFLIGIYSSGIANADESDLWYNSSWLYRKEITIDHNQILNEDQSNYALLFKITDNNLKSVSNSGKVGRSDGGDLLFTSGDGQTKLSHEIESYDPATGNIVAWIKVPTLSHSENTTIYIYYGNSEASDQQDVNNVWTNSYKMVGHMDDDTASTISDSTVNNNDGIKNNTSEVSGKIGKAQSFNGNGKVTVADSSSLDFNNGDWTISFWVKAEDGGTIVSKGTSKNKVDIKKTDTGEIWGNQNTSENASMSYPASVWGDGTYLYITDTSNNRLIKRLASDLSYVSQIGSSGSGNDQFNSPNGIWGDGTYLYIADSGSSRIVKRLASDLSYVAKIGSYGTGNDQFFYPRGVWGDGTYLYIADSGNNRIVKRLASDLSYVSQIGSLGSGNDQFNSPNSVWGDGTYLYITDNNNYRLVKRLVSNLSYVSQIGSYGSGDNQFTAPNDIWGDGTYIYIADSGNNRIVKRLASDLSFIAKIGTVEGDGDSQFNHPLGIWGDGTYLYIIDSYNYRIIKRDLFDFNNLTQKGWPNSGDDFFDYPNSVWGDGIYLYITDEDSDRIVKRLASDLSYVSQIGSSGSGNDQFISPHGIWSDGTYVYIADQSNNRIVKRLASDLSYVAKIGSYGTGNDQFNSPNSVWGDGTFIYITDEYNHRIVKRLASDLSYVSQIGSYGTGNDQFKYLSGIWGDGTYLYIADSNNDRVVKRLISDLSFVSQMGAVEGSGDNQFDNPNGIWGDGTYLYITDSNNSRIFKRLSSDLSYVSQIEAYGSSNDKFKYPSGIWNDGTYLYIMDGGNHRIVKRLASDLSYVSQIGSYGSGNDQFNSPNSIWGDGTYIYIADELNNRIVKRLASDLSYVAKIGSYGTGNDQFLYPRGIWGDGTYLYVADNYRIIKRLASDLSYVAKIGSYGTGNDQFEYPCSIWGDGTYVYIADEDNDRIVKRLASDLSFVAYVNTNAPQSISGDNSYLYVVSDDLINVYKKDLSLVMNLGLDGFGFESIKNARGLFIQDSYMYIADTGYHRILKESFLISDTISQIKGYGSDSGQFKYPCDVWNDGTYLYVVDSNNHRLIKRLASDLSYVSQIGSYGTGNDQFKYPYGIWGDGTYLYVADNENNRIVKRLASDLSYVAKIGSYGTGNDQFQYPRGIWGDGTYLYITDNHRLIKRLASDLSYVAQIGSQGSGNNQFNYPYGISGDGTYAYIVDRDNNRIVKILISTLAYVDDFASGGVSLYSSQIQNEYTKINIVKTHGANNPLTLSVYINGVLNATSSSSAVDDYFNNSADLIIGNLLEGEIDELRILNVAQSANLIQTQYQNENSLSFLSVGEEETIIPPNISFASSVSSHLESEDPDISLVLSRAVSHAVTVDYTVTGGTATEDVDYILDDGTITILAGETSASIHLNVINDDIFESNEDIIITLSNPINATLGTNTAHTVALTETGTMPSVVLSSSNTSLSERSGTVNITATLSRASYQDVTVNLTFTGSSASTGDYVCLNHITIPAGSLYAVITLTAIDNNRYESSNKNIMINLDSVQNAIELTEQRLEVSIVEDEQPDPGFIAPIKPNIQGISIKISSNSLDFFNLPSNIAFFAISSSSDFNDSSWEPIGKQDEILKQYLGIRPLYIKFRTKQGGVSDVIVYSGNGTTTAGSDPSRVDILDGDIIKTVSSPDVYIVKLKNGKRYKRLILSPFVFKSYGHLKWNNLKIVSQAEMDSYEVSNLVKVAQDTVIYILTPNGDVGSRRIFAEAFDSDSVYEINAVDRNSYQLVK